MIKPNAEIKANYEAFTKSFPKQIDSNIASSRSSESLILSYARIAALNAIKIDLIQPNFASGASKFFFEAHNDALLSHVNASLGSWRTSLQSLRSFMENVFSAIFFQDHPIEFEKWENGDFQISPIELREYCTTHPRVLKLNRKRILTAKVNKEYATLSKAVHASNEMFRMTDNSGNINIGNYDLSQLNKWSARERSAMNLCVTILIAVLQYQLDGAKQLNLRKALRFSITQSNKNALWENYSISIPE